MRISEPWVKPAQVVNARQQLESGNIRYRYENPHLAVAIFHTWLRELAEPLIPHVPHTHTNTHTHTHH